MSDDKHKNEGIDAGLIRSLADILNETDLTEIEVERGELRIRVAREVTMTAAARSLERFWASRRAALTASS